MDAVRHREALHLDAVLRAAAHQSTGTTPSARMRAGP